MRAKKSSKKGERTRRKDEESPFNDSPPPQNPRTHNLLSASNNSHPRIEARERNYETESDGGKDDFGGVVVVTDLIVYYC